MKQFQSVFDDEVGTLPEVQHLERDPDVLASVSRVRRIRAISDDVKAEQPKDGDW